MRPSWAGALIPHIHGDPFFSSVRLLMHFDSGAVGSRPVVDVKGHTGFWQTLNDPGDTGTPSGIATIGALMRPSSVRFAPYGTTTVAADASGAVIVMDPSADFAIAGDFTIEFLLNPEGPWRGSGSTFSILTTYQDSTPAAAGDWGFSKSNTGQLLFSLETAITTKTVGAVNANWGVAGATSAIAAVRSGDTLMLFVNGTLQATLTGGIAGTTLTSTRPLGIGATPDWGLGFTILNDHSAGLFDEVRITAAARYSAGGYTPAVTPFPDR